MQKREVEVKFYLEDIDRMQRRIVALGAESLGRVFENNIRYEDRGHNLIKNHSLLHRPQAHPDQDLMQGLKVRHLDFQFIENLKIPTGLRRSGFKCQYGLLVLTQSQQGMVLD